MGVYSPEDEKPHIIEEVTIGIVVISLGIVALGMVFIK